MKGRKADPTSRSAKTDPAQRRTRQSRAAKAIAASEDRARAAAERAAAFANSNVSTDMPAFMREDPQYAGAAAIWRHHEPLLKERNFWEPNFIGPFTGFCIYYDEFIAADREVKQKGWGVEGKSTSGGQRFWRNPAVDVRDHAFGRVMELSSRYAFTPLDLYKLERESAAATGARGGRSPSEPGEQLPLTERQPADLSRGPGALSQLDGEPPSGHLN